MARESWASRTGFVLAAVGSAVGLGNIWRFPWMTAENGGSAFLLVYLLVAVGVVVPVFLAFTLLTSFGVGTHLGVLPTVGLAAVAVALVALSRARTAA
jgi:NSS family neurotransmitter:Na+ symporter